MYNIVSTIYRINSCRGVTDDTRSRGAKDMADWQSEQRARDERIAAGSKVAAGKMVAPKDTTALLEAVIRPGDRICLEGDNQKQADFLAACLAKADPKVLHDLHVVQSGIVLPEHIDLLEKGIAKKLDFSYSGPQSHAVPRVLRVGKGRTRRDPYLHRVVRALLRQPHSSRCLDRRAQRRPRGQSVHGAEHRGFPRSRRSDRFQVRHCRRAGQ